MNKLVVLVGPTGVGKTDLCLDLAKKIGSPILSADSRQIFKDLKVGVASPTNEQLEEVTHFFIGTKSLDQYYSASDYEQEALTLLDFLYEKNNTLLVTGGSMMYIDALRYGIDEMPNIDPSIRFQLYEEYKTYGLEPILKKLKEKDLTHFNTVDNKNPKRVIHALEICLTTGKTYSSFRTNSHKQRPFECITIGLERDREELYARINQRVDFMLQNGLLDEVKALIDYKELNSLNTVGYKEIFNFLEGVWSLDFSIEKIKQNTRIYSKQQMRWFKKDSNIHWINLTNKNNDEAIKEILRLI